MCVTKLDNVKFFAKTVICFTKKVVLMGSKIYFRMMHSQVLCEKCGFLVQLLQNQFHNNVVFVKENVKMRSEKNCFPLFSSFFFTRFSQKIIIIYHMKRVENIHLKKNQLQFHKTFFHQPRFLIKLIFFLYTLNKWAFVPRYIKCSLLN